MHLFRVGEVLPVLAGPGLLDLWEHPGVRGRLCGPGGLHHPEVLHPVGKWQTCWAFWKGRPAERSVQTEYTAASLTCRALRTPHLYSPIRSTAVALAKWGLRPEDVPGGWEAGVSRHRTESARRTRGGTPVLRSCWPLLAPRVSVGGTGWGRPPQRTAISHTGIRRQNFFVTVSQ